MQGLSLNLYRPPAPHAAIEAAALAVMRRHISKLRSIGQLERPEGGAAAVGAEARSENGGAGPVAVVELNAQVCRGSTVCPAALAGLLTAGKPLLVWRCLTVVKGFSGCTAARCACNAPD